jgi:hypothetical protein
MGLLGEMTLLPGGRIILSKVPSSVDESGHMHTISYAAQSPWLRHQSILQHWLLYHEVSRCGGCSTAFLLRK